MNKLLTITNFEKIEGMRYPSVKPDTFVFSIIIDSVHSTISNYVLDITYGIDPPLSTVSVIIDRMYIDGGYRMNVNMFGVDRKDILTIDKITPLPTFMKYLRDFIKSEIDTLPF